MKKPLIPIIILLFSMQVIVSQNLRKANLLFEKRSYLDAAELFLKENHKTQEIQEKLGDCYYFNSKMKQAAQWYKVVLLKYEKTVNPTYYYRYSQALKGISKFKESDKWLKKYNETKKESGSENFETVPFFESLNSKIKLPYVIHKVSINSTKSDFGPSFYGNKIVFASTRNNNKKMYDWNKQPYLDLFQASIDSIGNLSNVRPFSNRINTEMHESNAIFTKDGKTMYFTRNNFINGTKTRDKNKITHLKIYKAQLINNIWVNIEELPFCSDNYSVVHPALSHDEKKLYFSSDMPGSIGSFDLFEVDINTNGTYSAPKNLGTTINTEHREQFPYASKNYLYFSSNGHFGLGGLDIFKSKISNNNYATPINLSDKINSTLDDFSFVINEETKTGYFSSNRKGGKGDDDIYRFTKKKLNYVQGLVQDKNSLKLLPKTTVLLLNKNNDTINSTIVGNTAEYSFKVEKNKFYKIRAEKKLYVTSDIDFSTDNEGHITENTILYLELIEDTTKEIIVKNGKKQIKHAPIYFDLNSSYLRKKAKIELKKVIDIMIKFPDITIECGSHTDSRASEKYNMWLSERRAKRTVDYIISKGISPKRISGKGYGEKQLINKCSNNVKCNEYEHQQNRRTEFVIITPKEE